MGDYSILLALTVGSVIGFLVAFIGQEKEQADKNYVQNEVVRLYSLSTNNLNKDMVSHNLEKSEIFKSIESGEDSNLSPLTNLLLIVDELKTDEDYPKEIDKITEEKLYSIALTEKMVIEKGIRKSKRMRVLRNYKKNYWKL